EADPGPQGENQRKQRSRLRRVLSAGDDALAVGRERGASGSAAFVDSLLVGLDLLQLLAGCRAATGPSRGSARRAMRYFFSFSNTISTCSSLVRLSVRLLGRETPPGSLPCHVNLAPSIW